MTEPPDQPTDATTARPAPPRTGGGLRRRTFAGLADQGLVAITTAGTGLLGTAVLSRTAAGVMLLAITIMVFVQGVGRAFVGDVMLTHVPRYTEETARRRQFENGHATSATLAVCAAVVLALCWLFGPRQQLADLVWGVPFVPSILLQDLARYTYQTRGRQADALVIDVCWVCLQAACIALVMLTGHTSGGALVACWGVGATAGAALFYTRTRLNPLRGRPRRWLHDTRHLLGWFTATGVLGQLTTLLIGSLVTGLLTRAAFSGLRLVQTVVLQPAQSFAMALNGLLVPRASQLVGAHDTAALRRQTRTVLLVNGALGACIIAVAVPLAHPVLDWYHDGAYAGVAVIAVPVSIQAWLYLMQIPFTVAIRGMHRARLLFAQYLVFSATTLTGLVVGAGYGQLVGAAWGLMTGAGIGTCVQAVMFGTAYRRLARQVA